MKGRNGRYSFAGKILSLSNPNERYQSQLEQRNNTRSIRCSLETAGARQQRRIVALYKT